MEHTRTGLEVLNQIKPSKPTPRFLQHWDEESRVLRCACGDDRNAVLIGSDGSMQEAASAQRTKLDVATVKAFLSGKKADNPLPAVQAALKDYIYLPDERIYALFSPWIVGTYLYSIFSHYGYLFLFSLTPRCGKTRTEEVMSHLAFEATTPRNAPTPPSMRETVGAGGTAIFDTLERWKDKSTESFAAAMELLDAGFRKGGEVCKMVPAGEGNWRLETYPVYAPYVFAAIDRESITETARDRSFVIPMSRKSTRTRTRPYDARCEARCQPIREQLYLSALTNAGRVADTYESAALQKMVDEIGLNDRAVDIWKPILAVATVLAEESVPQLIALAREMSLDPDREEEQRQLSIASVLLTVAGPDGMIVGTTQQIISQIRAVTNLEVGDLHAVLSGWGFADKSIRLNGIDNPRKGWQITERELREIETRLKADGLLPSQTTTTATTAQA